MQKLIELKIYKEKSGSYVAVAEATILKGKIQTEEKVVIGANKTNKTIRGEVYSIQDLEGTKILDEVKKGDSAILTIICDSFNCDEGDYIKVEK